MVTGKMIWSENKNDLRLTLGQLSGYLFQVLFELRGGVVSLSCPSTASGLQLLNQGLKVCDFLLEDSHFPLHFNGITRWLLLHQT